MAMKPDDVLLGHGLDPTNAQHLGTDFPFESNSE